MRMPFMFLFLFHAWMISAQSDSTGVIKGSITDNNTGEAVIFAVVQIAGTQTGVVSDIEGNYILPKLAPGTYTLVARIVGYKNDTITGVVVRANLITILNIKLEQIYCCGPDPIYVPAFNRKRGWIVGGIQTALVTGSLIGLNELWYRQYPRSAFHTFNDNAEWLQMDKIGHVQSAYAIGYISARMWTWTLLHERKAILIGGLTGFGYLTAIEIMDGYSTGWGFSTGDLIANAAGSALLIGQELLWHNQRIQPKFGFKQSAFAQYRPELLGDGYEEEFLKDYNGQTYWLSVNVASFLGRETRFPRWLNVAVGYGANGMTGGHENPVMYNAQGNEITFDRYRQYYLSLDIDLRKLPVKSRFLRAVFMCVSFIKIPAPGIELSKHGVRPLLFAF